MTDRTVRHDGLVTYWSCAKATDRAVLETALTAAGFASLTPNPRTREKALKAALGSVCTGALTIISSLEGKNGYQVTLEVKGQDENTYKSAFTAKLEDDPNGPNADVLHFDGAANADMQDAVTRRYLRNKETLGNWETANTLIRARKELGGVTLRDLGGIYWIPADRTGEFNAIAAACEGAACEGFTTVYKLHPPMDADAMRAIQAALVAEITEEVAKMDAAIMSGGLGARALQTKRKECDGALAKIAAYEAILSAPLPELRALVDQTNTAAATAILLGSAAAAGDASASPAQDIAA